MKKCEKEKNKMESELKNEVLKLISLHTEGEYWDFKQQWHTNNVDLLHDIICMANSPANRDCYIVIGVEDKTCNILGVSNEKRKNQQNVLDLLRQKPSWAGGYIPEVYVKTIFLEKENKEIDVVIVKQSNNTPFYLLEDYEKDKKKISKGAIYTRKGDTNTPKTDTADLYDTEILWKRRFGLLYNPSQRAKIYLKDLDNWQRVDGEIDKSGATHFFFFYRPDPDFTIYFVDEEESEAGMIAPNNINDDGVGEPYYYLYSFCNVCCHTEFCREKVVLYYKEVPLFSTLIEKVDQGRTSIVPPEFSVIDPHYIEDSIRYLMFNFVFTYWCEGYSEEAKEMFLRVIPVYKNDKEHKDFIEYIKSKGFTQTLFEGEMKGEALERIKNTCIRLYNDYGNLGSLASVAKELRENKDLVINFASSNNAEYTQIAEALQKWKMVVDWLEEWRNSGS